jgi:hypothetical protein
MILKFPARPAPRDIDALRDAHPGKGGKPRQLRPAVEPLKVVAAPQLPAATEPVEETACPFLAYRLDRNVHGSAPSDLHRCWQGDRPRPVALGHQAEVCLPGRQALCPLLQQRAFRSDGPVDSAISRASRKIPRPTRVTPRRRGLALLLMIGALFLALSDSAQPLGFPTVDRDSLMAAFDQHGSAPGQMFADWSTLQPAPAARQDAPRSGGATTP